MTAPIVVKVSGSELDDPAYLQNFAQAIHALNAPTVIVHGGGAEISSLQKSLDIQPQYLNGVRITDAQSLRLVEMVLCGTVNKRVVRALLAAGLDALGISGVDRGLVRARKMPNPTRDMGFTGEVAAVRAEVLTRLLDEGITPVVAPVCLGEDSSYNVNADHVAGAIAAAISASRTVFLTNVSGVLVGGQVAATLNRAEVNALIDDGTIFAGMIPKVQTALHALTMGVQQAVITDLAGLQAGGGTVFRAE
ncbi:MAG: acetylglutamate kinase [Anaerolineae bacterium]|nr:acetylglutamate kinase [Anaerolineae bacterium]